MTEARRNIDSSDYVRIDEIIKNDERMLNYLKCDSILSHRNIILKLIELHISRASKTLVKLRNELKQLHLQLIIVLMMLYLRLHSTGMNLNSGLNRKII